MDIQDLMKELHTKNESKIVLLIAEMVGGLPVEPGGPTELEAANTPIFIAVARQGVLGAIELKAELPRGAGPGHRDSSATTR